MSQKTRLEKLEDHHLTPKEAVILWMREAHEFDCLLGYVTWLRGQPDESYPLVRMPAQVVEAVRSAHKGMRDECLREDFVRVQKEVLFLFHLHQQVNLRAVQSEESIRLKLTLLGERLREIVRHAHHVDSLRLKNLEFPEDLGKIAGRRRNKTEDELDLEKSIAAWPREEVTLWGEVAGLIQAADLISRRYLAREQLFFPGAEQGLRSTLAHLEGLREVYLDVVAERPPDCEADFIRWVIEGANRRSPTEPNAREAENDIRPDTRKAARATATHFVVMARAETLRMLGDQDGACAVVEEWMRSVERDG